MIYLVRNEVELLCTSKLDMAISISEIKCHMGPVAYIMSISIVLKGLVTRSYRQGRHDVALECPSHSLASTALNFSGFVGARTPTKKIA